MNLLDDMQISTHIGEIYILIKIDIQYIIDGGNIGGKGGLEWYPWIICQLKFKEKH